LKKQLQHFINKTSFIGFILICLLSFQIGFSQDLENIGSKTLDKIKNSPFKINGGISANSIFYNSNGRSSREPFTYFLQGNLNLSWLTFSMPVSYSFSNQGSNLGYQTPFKFNRVSISPKYKWIQSHIGDVAMTFSPYTLSGHQFTGGGLELTPKGNFNISAMYGRLLKATEDDGQPQSVPAFKRMGYGTKLGWKKEIYKIGLIGFYAKDQINSITAVPDDRNIKPKENLVIALDGEVTIAKNYTVKAEYASTAITQDTRAENSDEKGTGLASLLFNSKGSTEYFNAYKMAVDFQVDKMKLGLAYERIDPGYETLGAYFFNNDFENITLNGSRPLFKDKLNLSFNVGFQRDNLENQKTQATSRLVGAINATLKATDKITLTGSYSNFSTYTNQSLNQFDDINDSDLTDEDLEALDFKQLSQNANVNINWVLAEGEKNSQNINLNYSLASSANEQAGIIRVGQANNFHNANAVYTIGFPKKSLNVSTSLNYTYSDVGRDDSDAYGGALDISKKFFENKLNSTLGVAYNTNKNRDIKTDVLNFRANASMVVAEKHNFNLNAVQLFRTATSQDALNELTVTFGYAYTFTGFKKKKSKQKKKPESKPPITKTKKVKKDKTKEFKFSYKKHSFTGNPKEITPKVIKVRTLDKFKMINGITSIAKELSLLEKQIVSSETNKKKYKEASINYLKYLYDKNGFKKTYDNLVNSSIKKLYNEAKKMNVAIEKSYYEIQAKVNGSIDKDPIDIANLKKKKNQYDAHLWMISKLKQVTFIDVKESNGLLGKFKDSHLNKVFEMLDNKTPIKKIEVYLEIALIELYHKDALLNTSKK